MLLFNAERTKDTEATKSWLFFTKFTSVKKNTQGNSKCYVMHQGEV